MTRKQSISKRIDRIDAYKQANNNSLTCSKWAQYFKLWGILANEYATLIRS